MQPSLERPSPDSKREYLALAAMLMPAVHQATDRGRTANQSAANGEGLAGSLLHLEGVSRKRYKLIRFYSGPKGYL
jgi:hypothetical protein